MDFLTNWLSIGWWVGAILIVIGFIALVKGADWLVDGASAIAKHFGISDLVIGLTVVAFGTSMPEFVVNMVSVASGSTDLAITNILGSNIINTFVILGVTALVYPIASQKHSRDFDIPMSMIAGILVFAAVSVNSPLGEAGKSISRLGGIMLLVLFGFFLYETFRHSMAHPEEAGNQELATKPISTRRAIGLIIGGLVGLVVGGELIVKSAVDIATRLGVSEAIIGLTIVALGTSLPELATSVIAATKKNSDIAIGNVIGSNIFNVFFVLGTSAIIRPLPAYDGITIDAWMATVGSMIVWMALKTNEERLLKRWAGAVLLIVYAGYLTFRLLHVY
ncbi:MAG: calcium/sodium antiporter [Paludibacteraceae bacterium]|nr:calcium/sodium antiporter [Paludibacteraceae bacterium]